MLLEALSSARRLQALAVGGLVQDVVDVAMLRSLEDFAGPVSRFPGVLALPNLRVLFTSAEEVGGDEITAPLAALRMDLGGSTRIPTIRSSSLSEIDLFSSLAFDVGQLEPFNDLGVVRFHTIAELRNADALLSLPRLEQLVFEECSRIDGLEALLELPRTARVVVVGKNPFVASFRSAAKLASASWSFPPGAKYLPRQ
ncbi:MAG: hypothetical protein DI534_14390 [Leifsonia xyli]|nr:MAG: hypothetical protein DI534_14390 [Leifsonia xyli]